MEHTNTTQIPGEPDVMAGVGGSAAPPLAELGLPIELGIRPIWTPEMVLLNCLCDSRQTLIYLTNRCCFHCIRGRSMKCKISNGCTRRDYRSCWRNCREGDEMMTVAANIVPLAGDLRTNTSKTARSGAGNIIAELFSLRKTVKKT